VFPVTFEGAKLMVNKGLSNHFQVSHTINLSGITPSCYRFGATYVGTKQISPNEAFPILLGDIDPSGNLNANVIHQFGQRIRAKLATQIQNSKCSLAQLTTEYRGDDFSAALTMGNVDFISESGKKYMVWKYSSCLFYCKILHFSSSFIHSFLPSYHIHWNTGHPYNFSHPSHSIANVFTSFHDIPAVRASSCTVLFALLPCASFPFSYLSAYTSQGF
jgi:Eukaryotic porin.